MSKWAKTTRDKSHLSIQKELRDRGYVCVDLAVCGDDIPDIFVANDTTCAFVELKESLDSLITLDQIIWIATYPHNVIIALCASDIVGAMMTETFLTAEAKQKMLQIAVKQRAKSVDDNPRMTVRRLYKLTYES